jgi:hypothetical protein
VSDPVESAIDAEHSRQERAWDEAMTDIRADLEEVPGLADWLRDVADPRCSHSLDRKVLERAADKLERLAAEVLRLSGRVVELECELGINKGRNAEIASLAGEPTTVLKVSADKRQRKFNPKAAKPLEDRR